MSLKIPIKGIKSDEATFMQLCDEYFARSGRIFGEYEPYLTNNGIIYNTRFFLIKRSNIVCSIKHISQHGNEYYCELDKDIFFLGTGTEALNTDRDVYLKPRMYLAGDKWNLVTIDVYRDKPENRH